MTRQALLELTVLAPYIKPVKKRKTGKIVQRSPFLNSNDKDHWRALSPIKKSWIENAQIAYRNAGSPVLGGLIQVDYYIIKKSGQNYDPGNWYPTIKAIIDGLVRAGMIEDDNKDILEGPYPHHGGVGQNSIRVVITQIGQEQHSD